MRENRKGDRRNANQDYLLSDKQVRCMAGVPVNTVCYWRWVGMLPFVKVGRHPRVWLSEFQKTFQNQRETQMALGTNDDSDKMLMPVTLGGSDE